jgi:formamidopyrimidine-DNA glycosylase
MPELPEVETIRLQLDKYLVGHKILKIEVNNTKIFPDDPKPIVGKKITEVRRFGKVIVIDFENDYSLTAHVKLTGQFIYRGTNLKNPPEMSKKVSGGAPGKHTHVIFHLDRNSFLYYNDIRRFGWIKLATSPDLMTFNSFLAKLGPEPFRDLSSSVFQRIVSSTKRPIKVTIMDQEKMSGVGNIYANDALWLAKVDPKRPSNSLTTKEQKDLFKAIETVLRKGIEAGGASELAFVTPDGGEGGYQNFFLAYGKQGKLCPKCQKEKFVKTTLGGRGTYTCPHCQS